MNLKALLVLGMLGAPAAAFAGPVLIVNGASGTSEPSTTAEITANLSSLEAAVGNTVTVSDALPGDISGYGQVWDLRFSNVFALTAAEQAEYVSFAQAGGGLFVLGENGGFDSRNQTIASLLSALGGGSVGFNYSFPNPETVNAPFTGPNAVSQVYYAAQGDFDGSGNCQFISQSGSIGAGIACGVGTLTNAPAGAFTSVLDVNFLQYYDTGDKELAENLVGYVQGQVGPPPVEGVPEPMTLSVLGTALLGLVGGRRIVRRG